jgi:hypothetical protein
MQQNAGSQIGQADVEHGQRMRDVEHCVALLDDVGLGVADVFEELVQ